MSDRPARRAFPSIGPDPRYVEPEPVRRSEPDDSGMTIVWLAIALPLAVLILVAVIALAASRSGPDPTAPQPGVSVATGSVRAPAPVQASAFRPGQSGAPHEREHRPSSVAMDRHDAGVP